MNTHALTLAGETLEARPSGALFWPAQRLLAVSDLHLCKTERIARRGGPMLPPYETRDTLMRLEDEIRATAPETVLCLGDSFDDLSAALAMPEDERLWLTRLMAGRRWIWIEGNHDPGPLDLGGTHLAELREGALVFRHIAQPSTPPGEISGHFHPKAQIVVRGRQITRPAFLVDSTRLVMPAFGTYTGGLHCHAEPLARLMGPDAIACLTGPRVHALPMPGRRRQAEAG